MVEFSLFFSQFGFCVGYLYYISNNSFLIINRCLGYEISQDSLNLILFLLLSSLCLVRRIEVFAWTHLVADVIILSTISVVSYYAILNIIDKSHGNHSVHQHNQTNNYTLFKGVHFIDPVNYMDSIGFSIFAYEGVGMILPMEDITRDKQKYPRVTKYVMFTMHSLFVTFGMLCVASWGEELTTPLIPDMLP